MLSETSTDQEEKLRLAVFAEYFPPYMGSDRRIYELVTRIEGEFDVNFIVVPPLRVLTGYLDENLAKHEMLQYSERDEMKVQGNVRVHYLSLPSFMHRLWLSSATLSYPLTLLLCIKKALSLLRNINPDLVVLAHPSFLCGLAGTVAARVMRKPILCDCPDLWTPLTVGTVNLSSKGVAPIILTLLELLVTRSADIVVTVTEMMRHHIMAQGVPEDRISTIPNGVDISLFNPDDTDSETVKKCYGLEGGSIIVYTGRLEKWAGVEIVIKAATRVCEQEPNVKFLIVGDGLCKPELQKQASRMNIQRNVIFAGYHSNSQIPRFIAAADITIVPFSNTLTCHVASPIKLFEYLAMKKPVIASDVRGTREVIRDKCNGLLVKPNNERELAETILLLLHDKTMAENLAAHGRAIAEKNSWSTLARTFNHLCHKALFKKVK